MRFQLFLNHLSASQTIQSRTDGAPYDCYTTCNPYNCSIVSDDPPALGDSLPALFDRMKQWRVRREAFAYLVYDPSNNRLYETDDDGFSALQSLLQATSFESFSQKALSDKRCNALMTDILAVYI